MIRVETVGPVTARTRFSIAPRESSGNIAMDEYDPEDVRQTDPELYGRLLEIHTQCSDAGIWGGFAICGLFVLGAVALGLRWLDPLGAWVQELRSWWVYVGLVIAGVFVGLFYIEWAEKRVYRRLREELLIAIERAGISPHVLMTQLAGDDAVEKALGQLMMDRHLP